MSTSKRTIIMLTKIHSLIRVSDFRKNLSKYLKESKTKPLVVSTDRGGDTRVLMSSKLYNKLVETYEDHIDAHELEGLVKKGDKRSVSLNELKQKYDV